MSGYAGATDNSAKTKRRGGRRRNTAATNPPVTSSQGPSETPQTPETPHGGTPSKPSTAPSSSNRVNDLLAALSAAQAGTSSVTTTPVRASNQPAASSSSSTKRSAPISLLATPASNNKRQQPASKAETPHNSSKQSRRTKEGSVADRMTRQQAAPVAIEFTPTRRARHASSSGALPPYGTGAYQQLPLSSTPKSHTSRGPQIPEEVLDDIIFRFLLNLPDSEKEDETRICFQLELAHWFYIDFFCKQQQRPDCHEIGMREFIKQIFGHCELFKKYQRRADEILERWRLYKSTMPRYGAILLDQSLNNVLLVQGYYASKNSWGFPKGKINEEEHPRACAIREVFEETGFDFGEHSHAREHKLQKFLSDTMVRLYVVPDVPMDFPFEPRTRCEIREMRWFSIWHLPTDRNDQVAKANGFAYKNFYSVAPFVQDLQAYVRREQAARDAAAPRLPAGPVANLAKEKTSAFTRVVPKKTEEKTGSVMDSLFSSSSTTSAGAAAEKEGAGPSRETRKDGARLSESALFRPLTGTAVAPAGSNLANIFAASSAAAGGPSVAAGAAWLSSSTSAAPLAHPVPIQPPASRCVYLAPKEEPRVVAQPVKGRSEPVDIPGYSSTARIEHPISGVACSASELEEKLNAMLLSSGSEESDGGRMRKKETAEMTETSLMPTRSYEDDEDDEEEDGEEEEDEDVHRMVDEDQEVDEEMSRLDDVCTGAASGVVSLPPPVAAPKAGPMAAPQAVPVGGVPPMAPRQEKVQELQQQQQLHQAACSSASSSLTSQLQLIAATLAQAQQAQANSAKSPPSPANGKTYTFNSNQFELVPAWKTFKLNRREILFNL